MIQLYYKSLGGINMSIDSKSIAILRVLQILHKYSDSNHPLTQAEILSYLENDYGIFLERRAVSRHLDTLVNSGFPVVTEKNKTKTEKVSKRGSYLEERDFDDAELRLLIDAVLSSKYIEPRWSKEIINKLCALSSKYFRSHVKNIYSVGDWEKTDNMSVFTNIEVIDEAIERKLQIRFDYAKYGVDKKLHKTRTFRVTPYQLILHNQRYYLMAKNEHFGEGMTYFRMDHITNITIAEDKKATIISDVEGFKSGIDYKVIATAMPYMYSDAPKRVQFVADKSIIDHIIDWFGRDISIVNIDENQILVTFKVSLDAMEYWAMQYLKYVEIKEPVELRERIKENIKAASEKYI